MSVAMHDEPIVSGELRAPFPWFGGKRRVASMVWERFGNVDTYNEPFAGSLAVLLGRPQPPRVETVNDLDCFLANFWRALQADPDGVAFWADAPVNEADMHARHRWLVTRGRRLVARCSRDPHYFNAKVAGWWVWGQCLWIGSGWCQSPGAPRGRAGDGAEQQRRPQLSHDNGIITRHANGTSADLIPEWDVRPDLSSANGRGGLMTAQRTAKNRSGENPSEQHKRFRTDGDSGVVALAQKRPMATGNGQGCGVHRKFDEQLGTADQRRRPHLLRDKGVAARRWQGGGQGGGSGIHAPSLQTAGLYEYMQQLAARLRRVRVCCGDWKRVLTPSVTTYIGVTGVFLDPPYSHDLRERCYSEDHDISAAVRAWALEHGDEADMRIALCGYEDEHKDHMPSSWDMVSWKAHGGYSRTERGVANRERERIWFSPHCLKPQPSLFEGAPS